MTTSRRIATLALAAAGLAGIAGCSSHPRYYAVAPPPPPVYGPSPIVQLADSNGYREGRTDGERDLFNHFGYRPQWDRRYANTPGYDPHLGPFNVYRNQYRIAYLHGYDVGFRRAEQGR
jgi:hypothetical protein